jgi:hypothetical protein
MYFVKSRSGNYWISNIGILQGFSKAKIYESKEEAEKDIDRMVHDNYQGEGFTIYTLKEV